MQDSIQIFTASSGKPSARILLSDDTTRHLHSTVKPEAEADYFKDFNFWGNIIVFAGIGLGYHLEKKIKDIPPSALLIVIDYYDKLIEHNLNNIFVKLSSYFMPISIIIQIRHLAMIDMYYIIFNICQITFNFHFSLDILK